MKTFIYHKLSLILVVFVLFSCADQKKQGVTAVKKSKSSNTKNSMVTTLDKGFYKAKFLPVPDKILVTSQNDKGLAIYDFKEDVVQQLNSKDGAGVRPILTPDNKYVVYQTQEFKNRRRYSNIILQDVSEMTSYPVVTDKRNIKLIGADNDNVYYLEDNKVIAYNIATKKKTVNPTNVTLAFSDNDLNLVLYKNGKMHKLNPQGEGNYIWVSLSPDKSKILYNKAGKGTFVADLSGKTIANLGRLHAAKWNLNGKWIIGMDDYDDGNKYTKSDIIMVSADGKIRKNLTKNSDVIALYPDIAPNDDKVIYHNEEGRVYVMQLKQEK